MAREISAYVASWNVNGKLCKDDLSAWLTPTDQTGTLVSPRCEFGWASPLTPIAISTTVRPDLYVLGFQEFDLTKESFVQNDPKRLKDWEDKIERTLASCGNYEKVAASHLVGMLIIVYATPEIRDQISELDTAMVGCGYVGIMGNKVCSRPLTRLGCVGHVLMRMRGGMAGRGRCSLSCRLHVDMFCEYAPECARAQCAAAAAGL